jgi:hypothetical protein
MTTHKSTIIVQYIGKGLYSAHSSEYPDCQAVAGSEDGVRAAVEEAIRKLLLERESNLSPTAQAKDHCS